MIEDTHHAEIPATAQLLQAVLVGLPDRTWQLRIQDATIQIHLDLEIVPIFGESPIPRSVSKEGDVMAVLRK